MNYYTYKFLWKGEDGLYHEKYLDAVSKKLAEVEFECLFGSIERMKVKVSRLA